MPRPVQITIAGAISLAWAAQGLVLGALYTTATIEVPGLENTPSNIDPTTLRVFSGTATMLAAALWTPIGVGLLRRKKWARSLALILCGVGIPSNILFLLGFGASLGLWPILINITYTLTAAIMIWLLLQEPAQEAFGVTPQATLDTRVRPAGIKVLVALSVLSAVGSIVASAAYGFALGAILPDLNANPETRRVMTIGLVGAALPWVAGYALCAFGLWRLRNWARILAIVLASLWLLPSVLLVVVGALTLLKAPSLLVVAIFLVMAVVLAAIPVWILWYLLRSSTKQLFLTPAAPPSSPSVSS